MIKFSREKIKDSPTLNIKDLFHCKIGVLDNLQKNTQKTIDNKIILNKIG
jgi:hypothetical protein